MDSKELSPEIAYITSPLGFIEIRAERGSVTGLYFLDEMKEEVIPEMLQEAVRQLKLYFTGGLTSFDLPVWLKGTAFQKSVWDKLMEIPYGSTTSYGEIAAKLGLKNGARAVGLANGANPLSIIIPCHRVISHSGKLTGYSGGLWRKEWLLKLEQREMNIGLFEK